MPAKHTINTDAKLLITEWEGDAIDIDFIEALKKYQSDIQSQNEYRNFNEIVDLTKVTSFKLTTDGLRNIGSIAANTDSHDAVTKLAIIVPSKFAYGLARMYEVYRSFSNKSTKNIHIFRNETDALHWINEALENAPS